jgi:hypothetical protein
MSAAAGNQRDFLLTPQAPKVELYIPSRPIKTWVSFSLVTWEQSDVVTSILPHTQTSIQRQHLPSFSVTRNTENALQYKHHQATNHGD